MIIGWKQSDCAGSVAFSQRLQQKDPRSPVTDQTETVASQEAQCERLDMNHVRRNSEFHDSFRVPLVALLWVATLVGAGPARSQSAPAASIDAGTLIEQIKTEIQEARKLKTRPTLSIKNVKITLKTVAERNAEGGIKFVIPIFPVSVNASAEVSSAATQVISLSFKPEGPINIGAKSSLGLADAINSAKVAIQTAMSSEPPFKLDELNYEADFVLKADTKGGFSFWIVDLGSAGLSKSSMQHVTVELSPSVTP
jgi:hypothetical protein